MGDSVEVKEQNIFANDHVNYPDIFPRGLMDYPFAKSRIEPCIYEVADGSKVLDCGCNSGEFIKYLKEKKGCDVYGIDVSQQVVDLAVAKGLNCQVADIAHMPYPDATFDVVTLMEVLEHLQNPVECLKEIKRVLKPDGVLIGTAPHANLERYIWEDKRLHKQYYTEEGIRNDFDQVFEVTHLRILNGAQFSNGLINSFMAKQPAEILFKCGGPKTEPWDEQMRKSKTLKAWFGWTQLAGTVYYRMRGYADKMREMGVEIAYEDFDYDGTENQTKWQNRMNNTIVIDTLDKILRVADLSVWQLVGNRYSLSFLRCAKDVIGKPIITEMDDWIFDLPAYNHASNPYRPNSEPEWICQKQIELSDALIVSTPYIKEMVQEMFPGKPVYVIPNSIDFKVWDSIDMDKVAKVPKPEGIVRIGYTGCANHDGDLLMIKRPILKLLDEFPNLEFVTSHLPPSWKDVEHPRVGNLNRWVTIDKYPAELAGWQLDIGVAPLRDNHFNRSKSNLRWLEYSALKIPTVMSPVRSFRDCVKDGETGLFAASEQEWYDALKSLVLDEEKRRKIGGATYTKVKVDFNMDVIAKDYAGTLEEICKEAKSKKRSEDFSGTRRTQDGQQQP